MKRYDCMPEYGMGGMEESTEGDYVRYEDVQGLLSDWMSKELRAFEGQLIAVRLDGEKHGAEQAVEKAVRIINEAREEGESDLRCIRSRIMAIIEES